MRRSACVPCRTQAPQLAADQLERAIEQLRMIP